MILQRLQSNVQVNTKSTELFYTIRHYSQTMLYFTWKHTLTNQNKIKPNVNLYFFINFNSFIYSNTKIVGEKKMKINKGKNNLTVQ